MSFEVQPWAFHYHSSQSQTHQAELKIDFQILSAIASSIFRKALLQLFFDIQQTMFLLGACLASKV